MAAILPLLRWPAPAALLVFACAAGARAGELLPPAGAAAPANPPAPAGAATAVAAPAGEDAVARATKKPVPRKTKAPRKPKKAAVQGVLNLNRASEAELQLLPGIGKGRARLIVARRPKAGYASLSEVARVKGLRGVVQRLKRQLTTEGPTTLRPVGAVSAPGGASPGR